MASIQFVPEADAPERVSKIYQEIKEQLGIDFVPNLYRIMAHNPDLLEANWNRVKAIMVQPGKLDRLTREIIALAVSVMSGSDY